jgi:2-dehydro-3-deoxygluconokinase
VTRLPQNAIGDAVVRALRAEGVGTSHIARGGSRLGIYFTETGAEPARVHRPLRFARTRRSARSRGRGVKWDAVMSGAAWFHVTGITPALGDRAIDATKAAVDAAKKAARRSASISTTARSSGPKRRRRP